MKKQLAALSIAALGMSLLTGCAATDNTSKQPTSMEKEVVSAALLVNNTAKSKYLKAQHKQSKSPIDFDPNNIGASLSSFDALSLNSYSVDTNSLTSDKEDYANEEEVVYTLPDGSVEKIYLYFNDPTSGSVDVQVSGDVSVETNDGESDDEKEHLHGYGFATGAFDSLLSEGMEFDYYDDDEGASMVGEWKQGLAVIESTEYRFFSEKMTVTETEVEDGVTETEVSDFSSFALLGQSSFLAVEQVSVLEDGKKEEAYGYTSIQNGAIERYLINTDEEDNECDMVYASLTEKMAVSRYEEDGNTYYDVKVAILGSMLFVGKYQRVVTTTDGVETISYVLVSKSETSTSK